jgi:hypothetical protein
LVVPTSGHLFFGARLGGNPFRRFQEAEVLSYRAGGLFERNRIESSFHDVFA